MSELNKRIEQWRTDLTTSETLGNSDIHELETHLREEIEKLTTSSLSDDEAFVVASRRLGNKPALEAEFAKAHPHRRLAHRLCWMVAGILAYYFVTRLSLIASWISACSGYVAGVRNIWCLTALSGVAWVAIWIAIPWLALTHYQSPSRTAPQKLGISTRAGMFIACALVGLWWIAALFSPVVRRTMSHEGYAHVASAQSRVGFGWEFVMPFLLIGVLIVLFMRRRSSAGRNPIPLGSKALFETPIEPESRVRDEIKHLIATGLSDDEAALIVHHRHGDTHTLEMDYADVPQRQPHANLLHWMVMGVLGYFLAARLSTVASVVSAYFGYAGGVRSGWLVLATSIVRVAVFAAIATLAWRCHAPCALVKAGAPRRWTQLCLNVFVATAIVASWWVLNLARPFLYRRMPEDGFLQIIDAWGMWGWAEFGWHMLMPFLLAAVLIVLTMRRMPTAYSRQ